MWTILYEDDEILDVDKPEVMPAIPAGTPGDSLREQVESTLGRLYVVHRLDKDVSGVMLCQDSGDAPGAEPAIRRSASAEDVRGGGARCRPQR